MYELRSYKKPFIKGYQPIDIEVEVIPIDATKVIEEAKQLFTNADCWHITINEYAKDGEKELRGTPHWCSSVEQAQNWLKEQLGNEKQ